jgi:molybdenum cofactor cytidylyltransferase
MRIVAVLLAAGEGRRIGGGKALLSIGDAAGRTTFLARGAQLLARPGVAAVVAVLGHEADRVRAEGRLPPEVPTLDNPHYRDGMLTSIWCGLDAAEGLCAEAVLLHLVDHPLAAPETVDQVVRALEGGARIAVPSHAGRRGHPAGFARDAWPALRSASAGRGARGVLADHPDWVVHVPGDPGCVAGIDTPDDYRRLLG